MTVKFNTAAPLWQYFITYITDALPLTKMQIESWLTTVSARAACLYIEYIQL